MSLTADRSEFEALVRRPEKCIVGRNLDQMSEQDRINFETYAAEYSASLVLDWFEQKGRPVGVTSVRKHLLKKCTCGRSD